jgi:hypothetical protein
MRTPLDAGLAQTAPFGRADRRAPTTNGLTIRSRRALGIPPPVPVRADDGSNDGQGVSGVQSFG